MGLEKAKILVLKDDLSGEENSITVIFNPESYSVSNGLNIADKKSPTAKVEERILSFSLFFDTYTLDLKDNAIRDVRMLTKPITDLVNNLEWGNGYKETSIRYTKKCQFVWGSMIFTGIITKVEEKYEMFLSCGIPVRATLNITMREFVHKKLTSNERSSTPKNKIETDLLSHLSETETGNTGNWRELAKKLKKSNPRPQ